jgi:polar amino acid transport system substrate-binding protein
VGQYSIGANTGTAFLLKRGDEEQFLALTPYVAETLNFVALTRNGRCADKLGLIDDRLAVLKKNGVLDALVRQSIQNWQAKPIMSDE